MYHSQQQQQEQQQQQQQQQQQKSPFFYQPPRDERSFIYPMDMTPPPASGGFAYTDAGTGLRGENPYHGANGHNNNNYSNQYNYNNNQRQTQQLHQPDNSDFSSSVQMPSAAVMTVGVQAAQSFLPTTTNAASPVRPFGGGGGGSGPGSVDENYYHPTMPPPPPRLFQPFVQSSSSAATMPMTMPAPTFHENNFPIKGPFQQQPPPPQQQPFHQSYAAQQQQQPVTPVRPSMFARVLNIFVPQESMGLAGTSSSTAPLHQTRFGFEEDDLPLLEELGIFPGHIRGKAVSVINPFRAVPQDIVEDMDLAGPVVFAVALAVLLTLRGKVQFSAVYGHSVLGIFFTKILLSLMADRGVPLQLVISSLGYCLIPNVVLAVFQLLFYWLFGYVGRTMVPFALVIVMWSAWCATTMLVNGLMMEKQRYLIMYPMFLFYAVFAILTIF